MKKRGFEGPSNFESAIFKIAETMNFLADETRASGSLREILVTDPPCFDIYVKFEWEVQARYSGQPTVGVVEFNYEKPTALTLGDIARQALRQEGYIKGHQGYAHGFDRSSSTDEGCKPVKES